MPRGDRTGPDGRGPMTGRGMGYCVSYPTKKKVTRKKTKGGNK